MLTKEEQSIFYKKLGELIRNARKNSDKKQETLAYELGITRTSLVNIEHGNQKIPIHVLLDLARILRIEISELLPNIEISTGNLNKRYEAKLSNEISQQVDDPDNVMKILKDFIKLTQNKK